MFFFRFYDKIIRICILPQLCVISIYGNVCWKEWSVKNVGAKIFSYLDTLGYVEICIDAIQCSDLEFEYTAKSYQGLQ